MHNYKNSRIYKLLVLVFSGIEEFKKFIVFYPLSYILRIFPIDNKKIVLSNFGGRGYGDNPKCIADELLKQNVDCKLVWLVNDMKTIMPKEIKKVKYGSLRSFYEQATAKIWIDNIRNTERVKKRKNQYYIQAIHGSLSIKKVDKDCEELLSYKYVKAAKYDGKIIDLFLSNSVMMTQTIKRAFWYSGEILESGLPRNDYLIQNAKNNEVIASIKNCLSLKEDADVVLYAPTFRDGFEIDSYCFDFNRLKELYKKGFGKDLIILLRLHPNVANRASEISEGSDVIDVSSYPDMQELILITDYLVTDYSSSILDAAILEKKIIVFARDVDEYVKQRGLNDVFWMLPFPKVATEEELFDNMLGYSVKEELMDDFFEKYSSFDDGKSSERVVSIIKDLIE